MLIIKLNRQQTKPYPNNTPLKQATTHNGENILFLRKQKKTKSINYHHIHSLTL